MARGCAMSLGLQPRQNEQQKGACVGGGASGSMMLEDLMESIEFRGKPKVVDLTSQRKLADKASI